MDVEDVDSIDVDKSDFIFEKSKRIIVTGSSGSGKTHFVEQLVKKYSDKFYKIVICGNPNRLLDFEETACKTTHHKSDRNPIFDPFTMLDKYEVKKNANKQFLLIFDDLMEIIFKSSVVSQIFSKGRHSNLTCILLMQSYFPGGSGTNIYPQIKLNSTINIFTRIKSKTQIGNISRKLEDDREGQKKCINIYNKFVQDIKYGYLAHFFEAQDQLRYVTNLINEDGSPYLTAHKQFFFSF